MRKMSAMFILREEDEGVLEDDDGGVDVSLNDSSDDFPCFSCSNPVKELTSTEKSPVKK